MLLSLHIGAGLVGLASGAVALGVPKGKRLHRRSGIVFVCSMIAMAVTGAVIAAQHAKPLSVIAGALTCYLVLTALLAARRPTARWRWLDVGAMLLGLAIGVYALRLGIDALRGGTGKIDGQPAQVAIVFGSVALLAALLDARMLLARGIRGAHRIARHLWRMCFALFLAAASFFLGQAQVFPEPVRNLAVLAAPVIIVLLLMLFWLVRVLFIAPKSPSIRPA
jgi:uncharacterized membrane protein